MSLKLVLPGGFVQVPAGGGGSGLSGGTSGHVITASGATTIQDSGTALSSLMPAVNASFANGEAWDELENFDHADQTITTGNSIAMQPGPGTLTVRDGNASTPGKLYISGHVGQLVSGGTAAPNAVAVTGATTTQAGAAGKAFTAILHFDAATVDEANTNTDIMVGFQQSSDGAAYQQIQIGFRLGWTTGGSHPSDINVLDNGTGVLLFRRAIKPNDVIGFKIEPAVGGWVLYAQGGFFEQFGCYVGSNNWFPCYRSSTVLSGNIYPIIVSRYGSTTRILSFAKQTISTNNAANTCKLLDFDKGLNLVMHIPSIIRNSDGSMWITWQKGNSDVSSNVVLQATYIDPTGTVSTPVTFGSSTGGNMFNNGSVNLVNGQIWAVYQRSSDAYVANSVLHYKVLTQSGGVVSTGSEQNFTPASGSFSAYLNNPNHFLVTSTGRVLAPFYTSDALHWGMLYSDNNGATWSEGTHIAGGGNETVPVIEPNGTVAAYLRNDGGGTSFLQRATSADNGVNWTAPANTAIDCPEARFSASKNADGTIFLIGNENYTSVNTSNRPCVTGYIVGNGGVVLKKIPLAVYAPSPYNLQRLNYPDGFIDGNRITYLWAHADAVGALFYVNRDIDDIVSGTVLAENLKARAIGGYAARNGLNPDITRLSGLAYGTAALPTLGTATGAAINLLSNKTQFLIGGVEVANQATDFTLAGSTAAFIAQDAGYLLFNNRGGLVFPSNGVPKFINWSAAEVALPATSGGTGQTSYAVGDLLYASTTTALSKLADVATGSVLVSGGVTTAPAYSATPTLTSLTLTGTTSLLLGTAGSNVGNIGFCNATSGTATLAPPTGALGTYSVTLPNAASTLPIFGQQITFAGPTAARTITLPDAAFTVARTDAANTFTGTQAITGGLTFTTSEISTTALATPSALSATQFTGFASTVSGASIMGYGTTNDVSLMNRAGTVVLGVGPNTRVVNIAGTQSIVAGTIASGTNAFSLSATMPTTLSGTTNAIEFDITGAGSSSQVWRAVFINALAGYTGSSFNVGFQASNSSVGTGTTAIPGEGSNTPAANVGGYSGANALTAGTNVGQFGSGSNGGNSIGVLGSAQTAKNSATNIGVLGTAINVGSSPVQIGGYFTLNNTTIPSSSAALMADNGSQTSNIFVARDNGTAVFTIADGGVASGMFASSGTATTCTGGTIGTGSKANAGFVTATTTGTSTIVITFPFTAATGWSVMCSNLTAGTAMFQTAKSTTTATLSGLTTSGDIVQYLAFPY